MAYRTLEVTVLFANDLKRPVVSPRWTFTSSSSSTATPPQISINPIDRHGGTNPTWNLSVKFTIDELAAQQGRLTSSSISRRCALGDRLVGEVHAP
ncbi:hypothetical protein Nepgr_030260 [Nepenthes gracilis]|uniref:C2 domain-containing protein n=1 Tax=Nepenthes gracilis TaxID=150966 RepID=A0AAD3TFF8_NEPGR|nr:hypothetical protein Nepgr_030260 [Nepenthes gracilis]